MRGVTFSSLVVLVAAALVCSNNGGCSGNKQRYQVAAGAVSLGLGLIVVVLELFWDMPAVFKLVISTILLAWWIAAFVVLTFFGSFTSPVSLGASFYANGFFFTWAASVFAILAFAEALKEMAGLSDPPSPVIAKFGFLVLIVCGSLIELGAAINYYNRAGAPFTLTRYAVALGSASVGIIIILFFILLCVPPDNYDAHDGIYNIVLYILTVWWAVGAMVLTFDQLWIQAIDNGYFSLFFTLGTCLVGLSGIWRTDEEEAELAGNTGTNYAAANANTGTNVARY